MMTAQLLDGVLETPGSRLFALTHFGRDDGAVD
jgi:hypothetical protein